MLLIFIISNFLLYGDLKEIDQIAKSNIYLGPLQGILSASVGYSFLKNSRFFKF
jgi:hypothetical protein